MTTDLNFDMAHLQRPLLWAVQHHRPTSMEEATTLSDVRDYFMYLTLDGLEDPALADTLIDRFSSLQAWFNRRAQAPASRIENRFYMGFLFALEQILSLRHGIAKLPGEKISRQDFRQSWKRTAEKLGLKERKK